MCMFLLLQKWELICFDPIEMFWMLFICISLVNQFQLSTDIAMITGQVKSRVPASQTRLEAAAVEPPESVNTATRRSAVKKKKTSPGLKPELGLLPGPGLLLEADQSSPENPKVSASPPCSRWWPEEPASPSATTGPSPSARSTSKNSDPKKTNISQVGLQRTNGGHQAATCINPYTGSTNRFNNQPQKFSNYPE